MINTFLILREGFWSPKQTCFVEPCNACCFRCSVDLFRITILCSCVCWGLSDCSTIIDFFFWSLRI